METNNSNKKSLANNVESNAAGEIPESETTEFNEDDLDQVDGGTSNKSPASQDAGVEAATFDKTSAEAWPWIKS